MNLFQRINSLSNSFLLNFCIALNRKYVSNEWRMRANNVLHLDDAWNDVRMINCRIKWLEEEIALYDILQENQNVFSAIAIIEQ